jgi:DNA-binding XRE family transcriptional regulator
MGRISTRKDVREQARAIFYERVDTGVITPQEAAKSLRKISGLTQAAFALKIGISLVSLKSIERGTGNPTQATLERILAVGGLTLGVIRKSKLA